MKKDYLKILSPNQGKIFPKLAFLKKEGFYLAGGTALALQLGHRTSVDFDFYTQRHFETTKLYNKIEVAFGKEAQKTAQEKDTLFCTINKVDFSLRALTYFDDVKDEEDKRPVKVFDKNFSWEKTKERIFEEVKKYQLRMIKK